MDSTTTALINARCLMPDCQRPHQSAIHRIDMQCDLRRFCQLIRYPRLRIEWIWEVCPKRVHSVRGDSYLRCECGSAVVYYSICTDGEGQRAIGVDVSVKRQFNGDFRVAFSIYGRTCQQ